MSITQNHTILNPAAKRAPDTGTVGGGENPSQKPPVTILQVLPALGGSGGVERGTVEIAGCISAQGWGSLVASNGGERVYQLQRAGADHFQLPLHSKNPLTIYANISKLEKLIKEQGVDIVHARSRAPAWSAYYACQRTGTAFVTTFHGTYSVGTALKRFYNSIMTRGDRVIAISKFIAGHLKQMYGAPGDKIRIIHRGVDLDSFNAGLVSAERVVKLSQTWRLEDGYPVVMLPGRLTRWKGQAVFIEAIAALGRNDIRCVLVGSDQGRTGYRKELERLIEQNGLSSVVRIFDHCDDMPAAYMMADVVVSASTDPEAFGRVVIEAQALGRPVVAPDHGGACETIIEGQTGWLFPPGDKAALAEALRSALSLDEDGRRAFAERALTSVREHFSKDAMCEKTLNVYREVLRERGRDV
ncbi:glycosyltransferase family 4 protein [Magnetovibrio sp.]|uniref:glycosyltransferase family 4 protein n=1 Tax=Magnetovibrio sp. TaxID=2024836 RepID=UPI002F922316